MSLTREQAQEYARSINSLSRHIVAVAGPDDAQPGKHLGGWVVLVAGLPSERFPLGYMLVCNDDAHAMLQGFFGGS